MTEHGEFLAVAYGGGTNSTAMLCGLKERGIVPDLICFSDTGAEMPHTYEHVALMAAQVQAWWGASIITVRHMSKGKFEGLEGELQRRNGLPSLAFGFKTCSLKYKLGPQLKALKEAMKAAGAKHAVRAVGFDSGEAHRVKQEHQATAAISAKFTASNWYPLVDWGWTRDNCVEAIKRHGLPQPGKSSCYFCPASKRSEVIKLRDTYPELLERALKIEANAQGTLRNFNIGLGGKGIRWDNWLAIDAEQAKQTWLDLEPVHVPCGCYDN